jgi:hypothetical protein
MPPGGTTSWASSLVAISAGYDMLRVKTSCKGVAHEYYGSRVSESRQCVSLTVLPYFLFLFFVLYERYCVKSAKRSINSRWTSRYFWRVNIASVCAAAPDSNSETDGIKDEGERIRMLRNKLGKDAHSRLQSCCRERHNSRSLYIV